MNRTLQFASRYTLLAATVTLLGGVATAASVEADWPEFGRDAGGSQHSPLRAIDTTNVGKLQQVWVHRSGDVIDKPSPFGTSLQAVPIHVNGTIYYCTPLNRVLALDPATGKERWSFDPHAAQPETNKPLITEKKQAGNCRGVAYWQSQSPDAQPCARRVFRHDRLARIFAIDADTGRACADFGAAEGHPGFVSHRDYENHGEAVFGSGAPPIVVGDLIISAIGTNDGLQNAADGMVRAFDVRTGAMRWEFNPIPAAQRARTGAANVWSTLSADPVNGLIFVPTTSPSTDYYGGGRTFDIPLADSIVALRADSGKVVWSFQTIRHDLFDYDLVGHPLLVDITKDGKRIPAAILQTKMGWLFVFNRLTGVPLWPIREMAAPKSDVPGEVSAATQPVPVGIAPFARQTLTRDELFGFTPLDRAWCQREFDKMRYDGLYTPPSERGSLLFPSALGGGNWGGAAYDPGRNLLVIKAENLATRLRIVRKVDITAEDAQPGKDYLTRPLQGTPYRIEGELFTSPLGAPCTPPPWGTLAAIDMDTGKLRWQQPIGQVARAGVTVPESLGWGSPNIGGPITTAGGVTFMAATMDSKIRAFDTLTGRKLWEAAIPAPGMAVPITYRAGGRQFVLIAAGGNSRVGTKLGDSLVAFALPE